MKKAKKRKRTVRKAGRPSQYRTCFTGQVRKYLLYYRNATDKDIAQFFDVSEATLNNWKHKHPLFLEAMRAGKELADAEVGSALYDRAVGMEVTREKVTGDGQVVTVKEFIPGDVGAMRLFLTNRGKHWRDKVEHGFTDTEGKDIKPEDIASARLVAEFLYEKTQKELDEARTHKTKGPRCNQSYSPTRK